MKSAIVFMLFVACLALAEGKGLPSDTLDLLAKLQEFQKAERAKVEDTINEKRRAVKEVLKTHLARETKAGNLDAALEIRKVIEHLETPTDAELRSETLSQTDHGNLDLKDRIVGTAWHGKNVFDKEVVVKFEKDEAQWSSDLELTHSYKIGRDGNTITMHWDGDADQIVTIDFSEDFLSCTLTHQWLGKSSTLKRKLD